jgi:hypothetical protein
MNLRAIAKSVVTNAPATTAKTSGKRLSQQTSTANKLKFKVQFSTGGKYKIEAKTKDGGDKYHGKAKLDDDDTEYVDDDNWHATAISPLAASATSE